MENSAKTKWKTLLFSLWTPMMYLVIQSAVSFLKELPVLVSTLSKMVKESNPLQFDFYEYIKKLYFSNRMMNALMVLTALSGILMTVYMVFYYRKKKKITYSSLGVTDLKPKSAIIGSLLGIGVMTTISFVLGIIYQNFDLGVTDETMELISNASPVWAMVATVCVAPVVEEFIFRGFVFERLSKAFSPRMTILLSALIFGLIHLNIIQSSYAFVAGLVFGYFRAKYEDLWGCILLHIFANFVGSFNFGYFGEQAYIIVYLVGIVIFVGTMIFMFVDKEKGMLKKKETAESVVIIEGTNG